MPVFRLALLLCLGALASCKAPAPPSADKADALWRLVNASCVPGQLQRGDPKPCARVVLSPDVAHGWVVLKDRDGATQYLVMPTAKITGIEDPAILAPDATNYFARAWESRSYFLASVGHAMPRDTISLAINSPYGRSQNQLHIHIDCLRADVRNLLHGALAGIGPDWRRLPVSLAGHDYRARRIDGADLAANPFRLLADDPTVRDAGIARHTLVVAGATFADGRDGFVLLDDQVNVPLGDRASGEELQDHACAVAERPA